MTKKSFIFFVTLCLFLMLPSKASPPAPSPVIVAEVSQLQNQGNLPLTTLFSPVVEANYRVSMYFSTALPPPTGGTSSTWVFTWVDEAGQKQLPGPPAGATTVCPAITNPPSGAYCVLTLPIIHCAASSAITFQLTWGNPSIATYDMFYVVEKL